MDTLSNAIFSRAELWLGITILLYFLMNGAQLFETLVFVPKWTSAPPENLKLLMDGTGPSLKQFWIILHSLHEIAFLLAIVFCWKIQPINHWLLGLFALHFAIRVWTILYFAPNIMYFQEVAKSSVVSSVIIERMVLWKNLNYLRVLIFIAISLGLVPLWIKLLGMKD